MGQEIGILHKDLFEISDGIQTYHGPNQSWYETQWQRSSGCGPTTCSNLMWYLSRSKKEYESLCSYNGQDYEGFLNLMNEVWNCVTPGYMGVNTTKLFADGALSYGEKKGVSLKVHTLEMPGILHSEKKEEEVFSFLETALKNDKPVAFLNRSNGRLKNLESWHWVTITSLLREKKIVEIYDQNKIVEIDLGLWLDSSLYGGGFVWLE